MHCQCALQTQREGLRVEHQAAQLLNSVDTVVKEAISWATQHGLKVHSAGLATQRSTLVAWDRNNGSTFGPILSWQDLRTIEELELYKAHSEDIHQRTGLRLNAHYGATKMRWILANWFDNQPPENCVITPLSTFLLWHLLREKPLLCDPANASRSLLLNVDTLQWDEALLNLFAIPRQLLPTICHSRQLFGHMNGSGNTDIPLMVCTGDQSAVVAAFGELEPAQALVNTGTGVFIQYPLRQSSPTPPGLLRSPVFADAHTKQWVIEATVNGAGAALDWYGEQTQLDILSNLDHWQTQHPQPTSLFINTVAGLGSPDWSIPCEPHFLESGTVEENSIAVLESIIFLVKRNLERLGSVYPLKSLILTGGFSQNAMFCQKLSDLARLPLYLAANPEATAQGVYHLLQPESNPLIPLTKIQNQSNPALEDRYLRWTTAIEHYFIKN